MRKFQFATKFPNQIQFLCNVWLLTAEMARSETVFERCFRQVASRFIDSATGIHSNANPWNGIHIRMMAQAIEWKWIETQSHDNQQTISNSHQMCDEMAKHWKSIKFSCLRK